MVVTPASTDPSSAGAACDLAGPGDPQGADCTCPSCTLHAWARRQTREAIDFTSAGPTQRRTWLTLLDTSATGGVDGSGPGNGPTHGHILGLTLQRALAPFRNDGQGDVRVRHRIGMPLSRVSEAGAVQWDVEGGGDFGGVDWLAVAAVRAVETWRGSGGTDPSSDPDAEPLVLNLSLGFHERGPEWGAAADPAAWRMDVQALYDALRYARCRGALVLAASGNRTGGRDAARGNVALDDDPMLPGHWAHPDHDVSAWDCACDFEVEAPWSDGTPDCTQAEPVGSPSEPLVHAVGGLGFDAAPIELSRPDLPPLMAPAQHAAADASGVLTGTSVASAVVSGQAALAWSTDPAPGTGAEMLARLQDDPAYVCDLPSPTTSSAMFGGQAPIQALGMRREAGECIDLQAPADLSDPERPFGLELTQAPTSVTPLEVEPSGDPYPRLRNPGGAYQPYASPAPVSSRCFTCGFDLWSGDLWVDLDEPAMIGPDPVENLQAWLFDSPDPGAPPVMVYPLEAQYTADPSLWTLEDAPLGVVRATLVFQQGGVSHLAEVMVVGGAAVP